MAELRLSVPAKRKVQGVLPTKRDVVDWGEGKIMAFLRFVDFFTDKETGKFVFNDEIILTADARAEDEPFWDEFLVRIDMYPGRGIGTSKKFSYRFLALTRIPLAWLKSNPHAVSEEMFALMKQNPRMDWATSAFKEIETELGVKIVVQDNDETTDPHRKNASPAVTDVQSPAVKFEQAKLALVALALQVGKSIKPEDLKGMTAKERIDAFRKLMDTALKIANSGKPQVAVFQQINIAKAGREELEKSFLEPEVQEMQ